MDKISRLQYNNGDFYRYRIYINQMEDESIRKTVMNCIPNWRRKRGRPRDTWMKGVLICCRNVEKYTDGDWEDGKQARGGNRVTVK